MKFHDGNLTILFVRHLCDFNIGINRKELNEKEETLSYTYNRPIALVIFFQRPTSSATPLIATHIRQFPTEAGDEG
jgi:hypothetical protein